MEMSFLVAETGLLDVLSVVYAPNAVNTMFQRKAVTRANRGHFLVDAALNALLASMTFHVPLPHLQVEEEVKNEDDEDEDTAQASAASRILLPQSQVPADGQTGEERVPGLNDGVDLVPVSLQDVPQDTKSAVQSSLAESNSCLMTKWIQTLRKHLSYMTGWWQNRCRQRI